MRAGRLSGDERAVLATALPHTRRNLPGVFFGILAALCTVALLATSAFLITRAAEQPPVLYLSMAVVGVRGFALGRAFFRYLERIATHDAVFRQLENVRVNLLERLIPLAPAGLGRTRRGSVLEAMVSDVDELQNLSLRVVQPLVTSLGVAVIAVAGVALLSPGAAIGLSACLVLGFLVASAAVRAVSAGAERSIAPKRATLTNAVLDYVGTLDVLIAFGADAEYRGRVAAADAALTKALSRRAVGAGVAAGALSLFSGIAVVIALFAGIPALDASAGLTGPAFAVIVLVPMAVFEIVAMVPLALAAWRQVRASAVSLAAVAPARIPDSIPIDRIGDADDDDGEPVVFTPDGPAITLDEVNATWPGASERSLERISLSIRVGEKVLVEGQSGAGKTTLAHLLVRFIEADGRYLLAGRDVKAMSPQAVRDHVGLCEQNPYLFDESIRQNLLFAQDDATDAELMSVLDRVGLSAWVLERGGLDARVGERGLLVSGGQAQRIALARALLRDFDVIVLDEPTANVEVDLADRLIADLLSAAADRTVLLISHADVDVSMIDTRVTLDRGRLLAR
ncbi:hypothetical protein GCM10027416_15480 [Okibacterium endophyticum]